MPSQDVGKAISLLDQGRAHLDAGDLAKAEACFQSAAAISDLPAARNNWALCRYTAGAHAEALRILEPVLSAPEPAPFARALASQALTASGDPRGAKLALEAAIRDLDAGLIAAQWHQADVGQAWVEYTIPIKRAAGALGLDRLVLDLHGRWPGRDLPEGAFAAGVAAFHLGRRLLAGSTVPLEVKMGAAQALIEVGEFAPGEPIPVVHEGRPTSIVVQQIPIQTESAEAEAVVERARRLRDTGKHDEALRLLADLSRKGIAYPPAMAMQANLMRSAGELDGARSILESLEQIAPEDPGVLFNLAGLWMQYGNRARARSYADRIQTAGTSKEFHRMLAGLKAELRKPDIITELPSVHEIATAMRAELEERPISLTATLAASLKQIPVQWLNAAASAYGLPPAKRRPEREKALVAALKDPGRVAARLDSESPEVAACLRYLLEAGGWCKLQALTKRFGTVDMDGFFWDEQPPVSPLGRLRLLGLVFVGRAVIDGRQYKVAVVPSDLRPMLAPGV